MDRSGYNSAQSALQSIASGFVGLMANSHNKYAGLGGGMLLIELVRVVQALDLSRYSLTDQYLK